MRSICTDFLYSGPNPVRCSLWCVRARAIWWTGVIAATLAVNTAAQPRGAVDVAGLLARVGEQVEQYYARAQSIVCLETVRLMPLGSDLLNDGSHVRQLVSELRVAWEASTERDSPPDVKVLRDILTIDGRPPRPKDEPGCLDPKPVSPEPLAMLLPGRQRDYVFTWGGLARIDGRPAAMLDYKSLQTGPIEVTRNKDCISVELPGRARGRVWIDQETGDVLRLDERLTGMFDFEVPADKPRRRPAETMVIERSDSSIRYKKVAFADPEETVMLPASIETLTIIRNAGVPRVRKTQVFSKYRRFVTGGRIVQ
jgi:hypothetical protein